jgi:hypothetical protein
MALNAEETELFDFAIAALPRWFTSDQRHREELMGFAKIFGSALATVKYWFQETYVKRATGASPGLPDWANQHAIDLGTRRQANETDDAIHVRLSSVEEALIRSALLFGAKAICAAEGITGNVVMVELPRDGAYTGTRIPDGDTALGGTFVRGTGTQMIFTPVKRFARPPYRAATVSGQVRAWEITIAASSPGNNGTFPITGLSGNGCVYTNALGVPGVDPDADWSASRKDGHGNTLTGFKRAYATRGYRACGRRPVMIIILPYGSTASTEASVREMLRQKKAAGCLARVERRLNP